MDYKTIELAPFFVAGIAVRTINKPGHAAEDIGALWHRFMEENLAAKLEEKEGNELYCVYTDYEGDHTDYYTTILGCKVSSLEYLPEGFAGKAIPAGKYHCYEPKGEIPASVLTTWEHIWATEKERVYTADFDKYDFNSYGLGGAKAEVYVAVN